MWRNGFEELALHKRMPSRVDWPAGKPCTVRLSPAKASLQANRSRVLPRNVAVVEDPQRTFEPARRFAKSAQKMPGRAVCRPILANEIEAAQVRAGGEPQERDYGTVVVGRHSFCGLKRLFQHHVGEELVRTGKGITIWVVK